MNSLKSSFQNGCVNAYILEKIFNADKYIFNVWNVVKSRVRRSALLEITTTKGFFYV